MSATINESPVLKRLQSLQDIVEKELIDIKQIYGLSNNAIDIFIIETSKDGIPKFGFLVDIDALEKSIY